jgi:ABC-type dipeptide/oligopeptide/nickel transport system permease subunit
MAVQTPDPTLTASEHLAGGGPVGEEIVARTTQRADIWRRFRRNRLAMVGLVVLAIIALAAIFAEVITGYPPGQVDTNAANLRPFSRGHILGTDRLGRDLYTDVVFGARVSFRIGIVAGAIAATVGTFFGALAGFYGRWVDTFVMRSTDVLLALPYLLIALAIIVVIGPGEGTVMLVLGFLGWMPIARLLRASVLQAKESEYVEAARALGFSNARIVARHILPNTIQPVIVYTTLFIGSAVITEAALSFLGVGVTRPTPAWGLMVAEGRRSLATYPHMLFVPAGALALMVIAALFVGDGLRDALDPKLK